MQGDYRHILKYIGVFGGVQGLTLLLGVVKNKLVAVLIGPAGVGLLSLFNSIVRLMSDTTGLGISVSGTRMIAGCLSEDERRDAVRLVRQYALVAAGGGLVVTASLAYPLSRWLFGDGEHMLGLLLIAPVVALTILAGGELCVLKGLGRLRQLALVSALSIVVVLLLTIPLYLLLGIDAIVPSLLFRPGRAFGLVWGVVLLVEKPTPVANRHGVRRRVGVREWRGLAGQILYQQCGRRLCSGYLQCGLHDVHELCRCLLRFHGNGLLPTVVPGGQTGG